MSSSMAALLASLGSLVLVIAGLAWVLGGSSDTSPRS